MNDQNMQDFTFEVETDDKSAATKPPKTGFNFSDTALLSRILRSIGALIIVVSASTFLFQHWAPGNDLQRYLLLLGFTSVLSLGGLFCGLRLKENKGARTLLGLTLAVTPINFTIMGAMLFSQFSWDGAFARLPDYATWIAASPSMAILCAVGGAVILSPLCHLSFMALGHHRARFFSVAFALGNLTLLVPTRQPNLIAGVVVLLIATLTYAEVRYFSRETMLNTFEGRLSRVMLWVPALILVGRACYFYTPNQLFISAILTALATLSFVLLPQLTNKKSWQQALQTIGAILASLAWLKLSILLASTWSFKDQWFIPCFTLPIVGLLSLISQYAIDAGRNYRRSAAIIAILGAVANLLLFPTLLTSFLCLIIAICVLCYGYLVEQKVIFFSGVVGAVMGLGYHLKTAFNFYSLTSWGSLMVLGVMIIIGASLLERNNGRLREKILQIRNQLVSRAGSRVK